MSEDRTRADDEADDGTSDRYVELEEIAPLSLPEALSLIGEETRAAIIRELGEARGDGDALAFSELMDRVGVEDSGRFNYHLDKLVGSFVEKSDEGYELRLPGLLVYQAVVAGTLTDRETVEPFPVGDCPDCGAQLTGAYHPDHLLTVECGDCETLYDAMHFPARGLADRTIPETLDAAYQRRYYKLESMRRGVCQGCGGRVERDLTTDPTVLYGSGSPEEMAGLDLYATMRCRGCGSSLVGHPANVAVTAPVVGGFFADHGRDAARTRWWEAPVVAARESTEPLSADPPAVEMSFAIAEERLRVRLDEDLAVTDHERTDVGETL